MVKCITKKEATTFRARIVGRKARQKAKAGGKAGGNGGKAGGKADVNVQSRFRKMFTRACRNRKTLKAFLDGLPKREVDEIVKNVARRKERLCSLNE